MPNVTIVVDMVNGFCKHGNLASPRCDAAIPRVRAAIESRKQAGDQLIFLADTHDPNDRGPLRGQVAHVGRPPAQLVAGSAADDHAPITDAITCWSCR